MKREPTQTPDWAAMIEQMVDKGLTHADIGKAMGSVLTLRMIRHYRLGVQPLHYRGEAMIQLWCETMAAQRGALPMMELVRGHRVAKREAESGPQVTRLPNWPPGEILKPKNAPKRRAVRRAPETAEK